MIKVLKQRFSLFSNNKAFLFLMKHVCVTEVRVFKLNETCSKLLSRLTKCLNVVEFSLCYRKDATLKSEVILKFKV